MLVEGERLRHGPQRSPVPLVYRSVGPEVMRRNRFDSNFNGTRYVEFVCVWVLANEKSRRANLEAMMARAHVIQTGHRIRSSRSDLGESEHAPLRVAKRSKIPARNSDLVCYGKRNAKDTVVLRPGGLGLFNVLCLRDRREQQHQD